MNTLKLYPRQLAEAYKKNLLAAGIKNPENYHARRLIVSFISSIIIAGAFYFFSSLKSSIISFFIIFFLLQVFFYFKVSLKAASRIKKMEILFPDVIQSMASNLRAGMTVDRAFLLSARPEFAPLDQEIIKTGKEIATGKSTASALNDLAKRINSERISKTISIIISGLKAGGSMASLLEETSSNMKEKEFTEKRISSSVLMYVIFIFFAVGIGAPILFGLSSILVQIVIEIIGSMPIMEQTQMNLPFTFSSIDITKEFVIYFSLIFLIAIDIISSLVIGLVNKGDEKYGLRYLLPLIALSLSIFFGIRFLLLRFLEGAFILAG